jgi:carboxyl-terminal processing protease
MRANYVSLVRKPRFGLTLACIVLMVALCAGWFPAPAAPLIGPDAMDRQVARAVSKLMRDRHVSRHPLDDEISRRAMQQFIDSFDPRKMYFTQADIDEFMRRRDRLDDDVTNGNVGFAHDVFHRFVERLDERVALVNQLLGEDFDFTLDDTLQTDSDTFDYPRTNDETRQRWKKFIKYNLLTHRANDLSEAEGRKKIKQRYVTIAKRWKQTDKDELLERFLTAVTMSFDPHTTYMSKSTLENFRILMRLNLEGIGAALKVSDDGSTKVTKVIPGGAADKHGKLKPEDRIVSVGQGVTGEMVDVVDMKLNDVVQLIRGKAGTLVRLGIQAAADSETKVISITRAKIELEDSAARSVILYRGQKADGNPVKVGVIDLPSFYMDMEAAREGRAQGEFRSTTRDVRRILAEFDSGGVDVVVLDLRKNGGGSLTESINLTGLFIDRGPVVQVQDIKEAGNPPHVYSDLDPGMAWNGPLVVLTSKFSASASEILAGAIQDYQRGLVIGDEATHGKGTVQSLLDLGSTIFPIPNPPPMGALKITMQQFYRPNGDSTQKRGVLPDIVLPSLTNLIGMGEADLDYALEFDRIDRARFSTYNLVQNDLVNRLKRESDVRIQSSEEFSKEIARIDRYKKYREEKAIPLNETKYLARREAERDAEEEEEKRLEGQTHERPEVFADDFYNREVLSITLDYYLELAKGGLAILN